MNSAITATEGNCADSRYIVCGFYTPDYRHWCDVLFADLESVRAPHDFEAVDKIAGGWTKNTCLKPAAILRALDRHPGKVLIWTDVDCRVRGDLSPLASIDADVAMLFTGPRPGAKQKDLHPWSGTMVFMPTPRARQLVELWCDLALDPRPGDVDETLLVRALAQTHGLRVLVLDPKWCSTPFLRAPDPIIEHESAGALERKANERFSVFRLIKRARRRVVEMVVGKPYLQWKYGR